MPTTSPSRRRSRAISTAHRDQGRTVKKAFIVIDPAPSNAPTVTYRIPGMDREEFLKLPRRRREDILSLLFAAYWVQLSGENPAEIRLQAIAWGFTASKMRASIRLYRATGNWRVLNSGTTEETT